MNACNNIFDSGIDEQEREWQTIWRVLVDPALNLETCVIEIIEWVYEWKHYNTKANQYNHNDRLNYSTQICSRMMNAWKIQEKMKLEEHSPIRRISQERIVFWWSVCLFRLWKEKDMFFAILKRFNITHSCKRTYWTYNGFKKSVAWGRAP